MKTAQTIGMQVQQFKQRRRPPQYIVSYSRVHLQEHLQQQSPASRQLEASCQPGPRQKNLLPRCFATSCLHLAGTCQGKLKAFVLQLPFLIACTLRMPVQPYAMRSCHFMHINLGQPDLNSLHLCFEDPIFGDPSPLRFEWWVFMGMEVTVRMVGSGVGIVSKNGEHLVVGVRNGGNGGYWWTWAHGRMDLARSQTRSRRAHNSSHALCLNQSASRVPESASGFTQCTT